MNNIFLFYGPETFLSREKIQAWKKIFSEKHGSSGFSHIDCQSGEDQNTTLSAIRHTLQQPPLFQKNSFTVISHLSLVKNVDFLDSILLLCVKVPKNHVVVLFEEDILDSNTFFKKCREYEKKSILTFEYFEYLRESSLLKWMLTRTLFHKSTISQDAATLLLQLLAPPKEPFSKEPSTLSLWSVEQELCKLSSYQQGKTIEASHVKELVSFQSQSHLFDLTDALLGNSLQTIFTISQNLLRVPKSVLRKEALSITAFLISQFRSFLLLKAMEEASCNSEEQAKNLSWNPKRLWVVSRKIKTHSSQTLSKSYSLLLELDCDLKTTYFEPICSLERTLLSVHSVLTKKSSF